MPSPSRPWPYARVLAHRGGGTLAPENTLAALQVGLEHGFRAVEFDAMLAADGVPVLMHDATLERTAGARGAVAARSAAELAALDAGAWHSARFAGTPIPRLAEALQFCRRHALWPNVEIKPAPGFEAATGTAVALQVAAAYADVVVAGGDRADALRPAVPLLSSFAADALLAARAAVPALPRGWLVDHVPDAWADGLDALGAVALHCNHRHLDRATARAIKDGGRWLFCYTVNDPARARALLDWGVDAFCTDRIDLIGADFA